MKKIILVGLIIFLGTVSAWATPVQIISGQPVVFAVSDVAGHPAFSLAEQATLLATYGGSAVPYTRQAFEINLSTCLYYANSDGEVVISFDNYDEWISCQTRAGLKRFIRKIRIYIDSIQDLPASDKAEINQRAGWVRSYFATLP